MNIIKKIMLFIKNTFNKQENVKKLPEPTATVTDNRKKLFIESLKIATIPQKTKKNIETLICNGDGLGIQKKITF